MSREFVLQGKKEKYPYLVTNLGLAVMERETGLKVPQLLNTIAVIQTKQKEGATIQELAGRIGLFEVMSLLLAGLEGHRQKFRTRPEAYTLTEVDEILDDCGGMNGVSEVMNNAMAEFWPKLLGAQEPQRSAPPKKTPARRRKTSKSS